MKPLITKKITSNLEALEYLDFITKEYIYHPDSPAEDIVTLGTGERLYSDEEATQINQRNEEIFEYLVDPYSYCLMLAGVEQDNVLNLPL